jgi:hypothetical protein
MRLWSITLLVWSIALGSSAAWAQKKKAKPAPSATEDGDGGGDRPKRRKKQRVFDFGAFGLEGSMKTPQLLYFLGRAKQELDRASLEKRSFMPELVRAVDEGGL